MVIGNIWNLFSKSHGINAGTSIFYDLYVNDKIGHKIVSTIQCEALDLNQTRHFMQQKMKQIVKKYPHFGSRIINHNWMKVDDLNYDKLVIVCDKKRDEAANEILNSTFDSELPSWQVIITKDNCILFTCDHTYGDGAYIANVVRELLDDDSLNNLPLKNQKGKSLTLLSRIWLFFKIIYLIYRRFTLLKKPPSAPWRETNNGQIEIATLSLAGLKELRDRFSCSDGTRLSINDLIHTIITRANSIYLKKSNVSSAAMFNMRSNMADFNDQNKIGYILLTNKVNNDGMPEEVLREVHDFMQFYKLTPATAIISKLMHLYYAWNRDKACKLLRDLNSSVDFIISNYMFEYKDKHIQHGIKIVNAFGTVTPCDANQMYSISTYGDKVNIYLTYNKDVITEVEKLRAEFDNAMQWLCQ